MKLGVCTVQRLSGSSFLEWFAYYQLQGVDKFIVWNHSMPGDPPDLGREYALKLAQHFDVEQHDCTGLPAGGGMYTIAQTIMDTSRNDVDWLIWADSDEFYLPMQKATVKQVLEDYDNLPISAVNIYWMTYGSSGHIDEPPYMLRDFTWRAKPDALVNHHMKPIIKGRHAGTVQVTNPHIYTTQHGTIDLRGNVIPTHCGCNHQQFGCPGNPVHDVMRINHYTIRSWEFFKKVKQVRGPGDRRIEDPGGFVTEEWYRSHDYKDEQDTFIWDKYGDQLVAKIQELKDLIDVE
jgi:hypothetical protein